MAHFNAQAIGGWGLWASLVLAAITPSSSIAQAGPAPAVRVEACDATCGPKDEAVLTYQFYGSRTRGHVAVESPLKQVDSAQYNSAGDVVVLGEIQTGIFVVVVVDPRTSHVLNEFWTMQVGVSPSGDYVAFTDFMSTHGFESLYADALIYVYNTTKSGMVPKALAGLPDGSVPVFPRELVEFGRQQVLTLSPDKLSHVLSYDFRWPAANTFQFFATIAPSSGAAISNMIYPVTIELPGNFDTQSLTKGTGGSAAAVSMGQGVACDRSEITTWNVSGISKTCAVTGWPH
ncbi:MAG: hypothetical protein ACREDT_08715 [Methylocella sp.]